MSIGEGIFVKLQRLLSYCKFINESPELYMENLYR